MAHKSDHCKNTTRSKKYHENQCVTGIGGEAANAQQIRGPGFVIRVSSPKRGFRLFITWAETGVAELSPDVTEAWRYPSFYAANDSARLAFGPRIRDFDVEVLPGEGR